MIYITSRSIAYRHITYVASCPIPFRLVYRVSSSFSCQSKKECLREVESALAAAMAANAADEDHEPNDKKRALKVRHTAHAAHTAHTKQHVSGSPYVAQRIKISNV